MKSYAWIAAVQHVRTIRILGAALALTTVMACKPADDTTPQSSLAQSAEAAKKEIGDAAASTKDAMVEGKDAFVAAMEPKLKALDEQIEALGKQAQTLTAEAKTKADESLAALKDQQAKLKVQFSNLKSASADTWERVQTGFSASMTELQNAYEKAKAALVK